MSFFGGRGEVIQMGSLHSFQHYHGVFPAWNWSQYSFVFVVDCVSDAQAICAGTLAFGLTADQTLCFSHVGLGIRALPFVNSCRGCFVKCYLYSYLDVTPVFG